MKSRQNHETLWNNTPYERYIGESSTLSGSYHYVSYVPGWQNTGCSKRKKEPEIKIPIPIERL